ncbi:MAG: hypothetical protein AB7P69_25725, partial [Candidatus Binatia bacterium]
RKEDQEALERQALMIKRGCEAALPEEQDREDVEQRYQTVLHVFKNNVDRQQLNIINSGKL